MSDASKTETLDGSGLMVVTTTSDDLDVLRRIAGRLVKDKLAACCQLSNAIESIYSWDGAIERAQEHVCHIKTTAGRFDAVAALIESLHNYDVPQIIGQPIERCSSGYRNWLLKSLE